MLAIPRFASQGQTSLQSSKLASDLSSLRKTVPSLRKEMKLFEKLHTAYYSVGRLATGKQNELPTHSRLRWATPDWPSYKAGGGEESEERQEGRGGESPRSGA